MSAGTPQGQAEFLVIAKLHPQQILLQRADEALRDAVAFGLPHEARGTFDAEERDLHVVGQVVRPVVVTQPQPTGQPSPMPPKRSRMPWRAARPRSGSRAWRQEAPALRGAGGGVTAGANWSATAPGFGRPVCARRPPFDGAGAVACSGLLRPRVFLDT